MTLPSPSQYIARCVALFVAFSFSGCFGGDRTPAPLIESGLMNGYATQTDVALWLRLDRPGRVKIEYWKVSDPTSTQEREVRSGGLDNQTVQVILDGLELVKNIIIGFRVMGEKAGDGSLSPMALGFEPSRTGNESRRHPTFGLPLGRVPISMTHPSTGIRKNPMAADSIFLMPLPIKHQTLCCGWGMPFI